MKGVVALSFDETWERLIWYGIDRGLKPSNAGASANLSGVDLGGADLKGAQLLNMNLSGANLSEAILLGAGLVGSLLCEANLRNAHLEFARAFDMNGFQADFSGASLYHAEFGNTDLRQAKFAGADVRGADFTNATGVFSFYAGRHPGIYVIGSGEVTIGCMTRTIDEWIMGAGRLGRTNGYTARDITSYTRVMKMIRDWEKDARA